MCEVQGRKGLRRKSSTKGEEGLTGAAVSIRASHRVSNSLNSLKGGYIGDNGKENGNYYNGFRV